jgi:hypothetical protein
MVTDRLHCRKDDDEQVLIRPVSARPWGGATSSDVSTGVITPARIPLPAP